MRMFCRSLLLAVVCLSAGLAMAAEKPVHLFILSGQSNMQGMDPEAGFAPEAKRLFPEAEIVYIKVARGGQPIRHWVAEWDAIAEKSGIDVDKIRGNEKRETLYYQPILEQYAATVAKHGEPASVTFCWMQGERDAKGGTRAAYKASLEQLLANLRRDLKRADMHVVIGRLSDHQGQPLEEWNAVRKILVDVANEDASGAWVDTDDLNNKPNADGTMRDDLHYTKEGYAVFGRRFARQGASLIRGEKPAENGRPE